MALLEIDEIQATRDPGHAAAPAGRPGAAAAHRRARRARSRDRRLRGDPGLAGAAARRSSPRSWARSSAKFGDERRTEIIAYDGDMADEDLIAEEDIVVTITRGGYAKRTKTDLYRAQRRGGKGVRGAALQPDDIVDHFFVTTTHHWILFFTNKGRVYRAKALRAAGRRPRRRAASTWPTCWRSSPTSRSPQVLAHAATTQVAPYLVLATKQRPGQEDRADRLRLHRTGRHHRDQPARGRRADLGASCVAPTTTCCWSARGRRRSGSTPTTSRCGRWAGRPRA